MKNKIKIILITAIITIIICASLVYAENETIENTTDTNTSTIENTVTNTTNEETSIGNSTNTAEKEEKNETSNNTAEPEEEKKSSNANLKNLGIKPNDFKGFKPETTTYKVEVPNNVSEVEVYAQAQDLEAEVIITGTGNRTLKIGENELIITVTAEDGTVKTYTIYVTRLEENLLQDKEEENSIEEIENQYAEGNGLASIKFENASMEPEFQTNIYEYQVKYIGEETELDIKVEPTDSSYIVQITGNENLQEGENIITILVSDKEDNNVATYQLTVNKKLVDEEAIAKEKEELKKKLIIGAVVVISILIIVVTIIKRRKNKRDEKEYGIPFSGMNFNEDNNQDLNDFKEKEMTKEEIRKNYLENYNNDYEEAEPTKRKVKVKAKAKGKRFK